MAAVLRFSRGFAQLPLAQRTSVLSNALLHVRHSSSEQKPAEPKKATSLVEKTGQTGAAVLGIGAAAYLISNEVIILNHETVVVAAVGSFAYFLFRKAGSSIAEIFDERAKSISDGLNAGRVARIQALEKAIEEQTQKKAMLDGLGEIFEANKEAHAIDREVRFRQAHLASHDEVIRQLNEMVQIETMERYHMQQEMVDQAEAEVLKALKGKEGDFLKKCITDLGTLAK